MIERDKMGERVKRENKLRKRDQVGRERESKMRKRDQVGRERESIKRKIKWERYKE